LLQRVISLTHHSAAERSKLYERLGRALAGSGHGPEAASAYLTAAEAQGDERLTDLQRMAAEELVASGHTERGMALLATLCEQKNVWLPAGYPSAVASWAMNTVRLRLTFARSRRRGAAPNVRGASALELVHTALTAYLGYLPVQAASLAARYLIMAQKAADTRHMVWGLGYNAALYALINPGGGWQKQLITRMDVLIVRDCRDELVGFAALARGIADYQTGEFLRARGLLVKAREQLRGTGATTFQRDVASLYDVIATFATGDYADLARVVPERVEDAFRRGHAWIGTMLVGPLGGAQAYLAVDQPDRLQRMLDDVRRRLDSQSERKWPHFLLLLSEVQRLQYLGEPEAAWGLVETQSSAFEDALGSAGQYMIAAAKTRCSLDALAAAVQRGTAARSSPWFMLATRSLQRLSEFRSGNWPGFVIAAEAALAHFEQDQERCVLRLYQAIAVFERSGARMYSAAARRRLGALLGGDDGRLLVQDGDEFMKRQGVRNLEAITRVHISGFASR
jgi:hypothetical protein